MNVLDLFAGIGGIREGAEQAGAKIVGSVEFDKYARVAYDAIHETTGEWERGDITRVTNEEWADLAGTVDVIAGGFPCQAFSIAGKRQGFQDTTKGTLFFEIARAMEQIRPKYVVLENVKGLLNHDQGRTFRTVLATLDELGYDSEWRLVDSQGFGVPQHRERIVIIGHLRAGAGHTKFVLSETGNRGETDAKSKNVGVVNGSNLRQAERVYDENGIAPTLNTAQGGGRVPKILIIENTKKGYSLASIGDSVNFSQLNSKTRRGRVGKGIANTLMTTPDQAVITEFGKIRKLSPKETWRLQGFADEMFDKAKATGLSDAQLYKQAGNSVTVPVFKFVFDKIINGGEQHA